MTYDREIHLDLSVRVQVDDSGDVFSINVIELAPEVFDNDGHDLSIEVNREAIEEARSVLRAPLAGIVASWEEVEG